ncbi:MAG: glycosyltransferase [Limnospira sp. PMC 1291.21]|uniref:Glycosyl transferase family 2 n=1 Tax=Limnospira maxima CS-328 TaxID=513049 RepID=B5W3Z9_LIMMA|nr:MULTISPECIES: glycosyltransferase [Limnospira]EKD08093.1 glycosyl transferase family 2 [Arthrospira platensis C1]MDC0838311.1 glycosyltransferase [Limnoraphis robusta]QJB25170.1 glycosyltransferase [Limnospira fusiformis SAG 85.79]EDZ93722.1 glycosyl transferase family 2 [Limnospira maxima CS-328]MDT9180575.1 glycosyltransferase [Limnospira sp. PMC 1238.20]
MGTKKGRVWIFDNIQPTVKVTIFAVPKAFVGSVGMIQDNAITSWTKLVPRPEIILFGDETGTAEVASKLKVRHIPNVQVNEYGTPLLNDIFSQVHHHASHDILTYINSDIILTSDFLGNVQQVIANYSRFLMVGRRWNLDIEEPVNFDNPNWEQQLHHQIHTAGIFSGIGALDYFVFPKPLFNQLPAFAIGRPGWDNWMVGEGLKQGYRVINGSQTITIVHQNHDYGHLRGNRIEAFHGREAKQNQALLQGHFAGNTADATDYLIPATVANSPQISIIVCSDNQGISLPKTLDSILNQNIDGCEIIVIDNGSTDNTPEVLEGYGKSLQYVGQCGEGIVAARNRGLDIARGEFILFLDGGSTLLPHSLSDLIDAFDNRAGSLEMVFSGWEIWEENQLISEVQPYNNLAPILQGRDGLHGVHIWMLTDLWRLVETGAILFRNSWVKRWGGFDSSLSPHAATIDLLLNLASHGAAGICLQRRTITVEADYNLKRYAIAILSSDCNQLIQNYFSRPTLRNWMRPLETLCRYQVLVWLAALSYHTQDKHQMIQFLRQSRNYSPYPAQQTINNWYQSLTQISRAYNYPPFQLLYKT